MSNVSRITPSQVETAKPGKASAARLLEDAFENLSSRTVKALGPTGQPMNIPIAWPHGRSPSNEEKTELTRIVLSIHNAMQTLATDEEIEENLALLIAGRKSSNKADPHSMGKVYAMVMCEVPAAILKLAVSNIVRGKADGIEKGFIPSTDILLDYCERLQRDVMAKAVMVERMLQLPEQDAPPEPMSEDQMARRREQIAALARPRAVPGQAA